MLYRALPRVLRGSTLAPPLHHHCRNIPHISSNIRNCIPSHNERLFMFPSLLPTRSFTSKRLTSIHQPTTTTSHNTIVPHHTIYSQNKRMFASDRPRVSNKKGGSGSSNAKGDGEAGIGDNLDDQNIQQALGGVPASAIGPRYGAEIPPAFRTNQDYFRRGFSVPLKETHQHWAYPIIQLYYDVKSYYIMWSDTNIRLTRLGFTLYHVVVFACAWWLGGAFGSAGWSDAQDRLDLLYDMYMADCAEIVWIREAMRRCELVLSTRDPNKPVGPLIQEAASATTGHQIIISGASPNPTVYEMATHPGRYSLSKEVVKDMSLVENKSLEQRNIELKKELYELNNKQKHRNDISIQKKSSTHQQRLQDIQQEYIENTSIQSSEDKFRSQYITNQVNHRYNESHRRVKDQVQAQAAATAGASIQSFQRPPGNSLLSDDIVIPDESDSDEYIVKSATKRI